MAALAPIPSASVSDDGDGQALDAGQGPQRKSEIGEQAHGPSIRTHSSCSRMSRGQIDIPGMYRRWSENYSWAGRRWKSSCSRTVTEELHEAD